MAKAIWTGSIGFGLVNIPISLVTAVRDHDLHFHQLNSVTQHRIRTERKDAETNETVPYDNIVHGAEVTPSTYVLISDDDLASLALESSKYIEISRFVSPEVIPPIWIDRHWYATPTPAAEGAYALLVAALRKTHKVGVGECVMRSRAYPVIVHPFDQTLVISALHWGDEVIDPADVASGAPGVDERQLAQAEMLIDAVTDATWTPRETVDAYTNRVRELVNAKAQGSTVTYAQTPERPQMTSLMEALAASVQAAKAKRSG